jgi:hypothetical protein
VRPLEHVRWIDGGSGAGKSTIGRRLAPRLYSTDAMMAEHGRRTTPRDSPFLHRFIAMDMDERWLHRSPEIMLETFHWYRGEAFDLIVEDLVAMPPQPTVVVEGFRALPRLVKPLLAKPNHAVWLLATPTFRCAALEHRSALWTVAGKTSDPERALRNLLERDAMFTDRLRAECRELGLRAIEVDVTMTEDELATRVGEILEL